MLKGCVQSLGYQGKAHKVTAKKLRIKKGIKNRQRDDILKENTILKERIKRLEIENRILNILKMRVEDLKKRAIWANER